MDEEAGELEGALGMENFEQGPPRLGWLMNISTVRGCCRYQLGLLSPTQQLMLALSTPTQGLLRDRETGQALSCINCYFMCQVRCNQLPQLSGRCGRCLSSDALSVGH
jgi:hypothetical protein